MTKENFDRVKKLFENIFQTEISTKFNPDFLPENYSVSKEGNVSLKFIKHLNEDPNFTRIEMIRFENSFDTCNLTFVMKSVKEDPRRLNFFQNIIDSISKIYTQDESGKGIYTTRDSVELDNEYWSGRNWLNEKKYPIPVMISKFDLGEMHITLFLGKPL